MPTGQRATFGLTLALSRERARGIKRDCKIKTAERRIASSYPAA